MQTARSRGQGWILDRFLGQGGLEQLFRDSLGYFLQMGYEYVDIQRASRGATSGKLLVKQLSRVGDERFAAGERAELEGNLLTARDEFHRAAKMYSRAQWAIFEVNQRKLDLHSRCVAAYDKVIAYSDYPMEKVEIPFSGGTLYGVLHMPHGAKGAPTVLFCPGLDMVKEDYPNVGNNHLVKRDMVVLSLDGPGHGESRLRGGQTWQVGPNGDNYGLAATAAFEYLSARPEVDADRIGLFGISQGSYWGPVMVAHEKRFKACACMMGSFYEQGFDVGQPTFKENLMYMTGCSSEAEVDALVPYITVEGVEPGVECALLVLHGELDELTPEEDARRLVDRAVNAPFKELVIYEDQYHPLGGVSPEAFNKAADWLAHQLGAIAQPTD